MEKTEVIAERRTGTGEKKEAKRNLDSPAGAGSSAGDIFPNALLNMHYYNNKNLSKMTKLIKTNPIHF